VTGGEDLDGLGAALVQSIKKARVQALLEKDVSRETRLHH
jgi:hypothetical protein